MQSQHSMMMALRSIVWLVLALSLPSAQACSGTPFKGTTLRSYTDPARPGRMISVRVDYPAIAAGTDTAPLINCAFSTAIIGHGFTISGEAYSWLSNALVAQAWVVARPLSESGFSPSHLEFAKDLNRVADALREDSFFAQALGAKNIIAGHSMGGGSAVLAVSLRPSQGLVLFAPAETNPSAIAAASLVGASTLLFTGSRDCVTPFAAHASPIFQALSSPQKTQLDIAGGSHCQFSDGSITCSIGEGSCPAQISAASQQSAVLSALLPWLGTIKDGLLQSGFELN
jgi:pimeloyl-ACP methyl ester carboxylesterase